MDQAQEYRNGYRMITQHGVNIVIEIPDDGTSSPGAISSPNLRYQVLAGQRLGIKNEDLPAHLRVMAQPNGQFQIIVENPGVTGLDKVPAMMRKRAGASFVAADLGMRGTCTLPQQDTLSHLMTTLDEHVKVEEDEEQGPGPMGDGKTLIKRGLTATSLSSLGDLLGGVKLDD